MFLLVVFVCLTLSPSGDRMTLPVRNYRPCLVQTAGSCRMDDLGGKGKTKLGSGLGRKNCWGGGIKAEEWVNKSGGRGKNRDKGRIKPGSG